MNNEFSMTTGQAHEVAQAFGRNGWTNEQVKEATKGNFFGKVLDVILGHSEIKPIEYLIDFDKTPSVPEGWTILPDYEQLLNRMRGMVRFTPAMVKLHLDAGQKNGKVIKGDELREKLEKVPVYGAQLLDFYLANQSLIPEDWQGKYIFFWGTIYRRVGGFLYVRYLYWNDDEWSCRCSWLGLSLGGLGVCSPAAVSAS